VVNDFNFMSLEQSIAPLVLYIVPDTAQARLMNYGGFISIRLFPHADLPETLATVEKIYRKYEADAPFEYFFLDEVFDQQYKSQDRLAGISRAFTGCALLISCLGLFGLAAFTAERRTKEIGIRKVLGASAGNIIVLLSRDFLRLVLLSCLIAVPLAAYLMHRWLEEFAYRISMAWWVFALAGGLALLIALLTVSYQSLKAASANPVDSLRSE
jgi:putative ABC transport system permease protein